MERQHVTSRSPLILLSHTSHLTSYSVTEPGHGRTDGMADRRWMSRCQDPGPSPCRSLQTQAPALFLTPIPRTGWEGQARGSHGVCVSASRSAWAPALSPTIPDSLEQGPSPEMVVGEGTASSAVSRDHSASAPVFPLPALSSAPGPPEVPSVTVSSRDLGAKQLRFKSPLHHPPAGKPWASHFTSLDLRFLSCKMGIITIPFSSGCEGHTWDSCDALRAAPGRQ